jgi:hypothetical protein
VAVNAEGPDGRHYVEVDDNGGFRLEGLRSGEYRIVAEASWNDPLRAPDAPAGSVPGTLVEVRDGRVSGLELRVEDRESAIRGRVTSDLGPVVDAFVNAARESGTPGVRPADIFNLGHGVLTDQDGRFVLEGLAEGRYTVVAQRRGGGGEAIAEHVRTDTEVELEILSNASVEGEVRVAEQEAPESFTVRVSDPERFGHWQTQRLFRTGGKFVFNAVPPGHWEISVTAAEGTARRSIDLEPGQSLSGLTLELVGRSTIRGRVMALDTNRPIPGCSILVGSAKGGVMSLAGTPTQQDNEHITGADGSFRYLNAPAGRVALRVSPPGDEFERVTVYTSVKAGNSAAVPIIYLPRRMGEGDQLSGDLGFSVAPLPTEADPERRPITVLQIDSQGPAAQTSLRPGDVITSVNGHDVSGSRRYLYESLVNVPVGANVDLGLARGESVRIVAAGE